VNVRDELVDRHAGEMQADGRPGLVEQTAHLWEEFVPQVTGGVRARSSGCVGPNGHPRADHLLEATTQAEESSLALAPRKVRIDGLHERVVRGPAGGPERRARKQVAHDARLVEPVGGGVEFGRPPPGGRPRLAVPPLPQQGHDLVRRRHHLRAHFGEFAVFRMEFRDATDVVADPADEIVKGLVRERFEIDVANGPRVGDDADVLGLHVSAEVVKFTAQEQGVAGGDPDRGWGGGTHVKPRPDERPTQPIRCITSAASPRSRSA
jgi:hypothetical protein